MMFLNVGSGLYENREDPQVYGAGVTITLGTEFLLMKPELARAMARALDEAASRAEQIAEARGSGFVGLGCEGFETGEVLNAGQSS